MIKKKKSLGQHFLNNPHYLGLVADAVGIKPGETVVEVGPGDGALTSVLLERGAHVIALEKDARLIPLLRERFAGQTMEIIEGDALEYAPHIKNYKVVGNIPYYISGALFKKFLTDKHQPSCLVFLVQKEVAERIVGNPEQRRGTKQKKESVLSLSVKAYGSPHYIQTVPRGAFAPPPKVDSAILAVTGISRAHFTNAAHEKKFFELVKKAFGGKRKMLHSSTGIDSSARPEDIPLAQWLAWAAI